MNEAFLSVLVRERPDLVFTVLMGYELWTETLDLVRSWGIPIINWGTDDSWKYQQFSRFVAPHVDCYATTSIEAFEHARRQGLSSFALTQWAASDALLASPRPARDCTFAVSFVGAAYGNRRRWIESLRSAGVEVACFGHGWPDGPISAHEVTRVFRDSVISLNFGDSGVHLRGFLPYRSRQIKARVFEVPGAGGFLLTEPAPGLASHFTPGQELATFESESQLCERVRHFLAHPDERDRLAWLAHERVRREHCYTHRFAALFELVEQGRRKPRGVRLAGAAHDAIAPILKRHHTGLGLRVLRGVLISPMRWLFGRQRGARAARRVLFELSWRLAGAHTYSAAGWPGRLFYRES
jgi:spore maturation protein CgeB